MPRTMKQSAHLLGVGLDNTDGHKRISQADRFAIEGGSGEPHERMTETAIKTFETLDQGDNTLDQIEQQELAEIIHKNTPSK